MKILVTGSSGFVGAAVVRYLVAQGADVRVMLRASSSTTNIDGLAVERVVGDLLDAESLGAAVAGCHSVYHVAADYRLWVRDPTVLYRANVDGTVNLMRAALAEKVRRVVYTSSVATLGLHADGTPANEDSPVDLPDMVGHYKRSKYLAEQAVQGLIRDEGLPAVIVNPSTPLGPGDVKPTPTGQMVVDAMDGKIPAYVDTGMNLVHVDDVATGHVLAYERGEIGERYILGSENLTLKNILQSIAEITGGRPPLFKLPHAVAMLIAHVNEGTVRILGRGAPRVSIDSVKMSRKKMFFSSEKARSELGYEPRPAMDALRDAIDWFASHDRK
ncbi:MAG: hopanoid-associated sugar epimerase [Woeseiaceae bacterium]